MLTVENDKSEKVTIENPILSNTDDEFPTIDIISPLKSPVKSASVAQDVDKPLKPKYKAKDFHKISSENKTGTKKFIKGKKKNEIFFHFFFTFNGFNRGERERKKGKEEQTINFFLKILPWLGFY